METTEVSFVRETSLSGNVSRFVSSIPFVGTKNYNEIDRAFQEAFKQLGVVGIQAKRDEKLEGFVCYVPFTIISPGSAQMHKVGYFTLLTVLPASQRRGLAGYVVDAIRRDAVSSGLDMGYAAIASKNKLDDEFAYGIFLRPVNFKLLQARRFSIPSRKMAGDRDENNRTHLYYQPPKPKVTDACVRIVTEASRQLALAIVRTQKFPFRYFPTEEEWMAVTLALPCYIVDSNTVFILHPYSMSVGEEKGEKIEKGKLVRVAAISYAATRDVAGFANRVDRVVRTAAEELGVAAIYAHALGHLSPEVLAGSKFEPAGSLNLCFDFPTSENKKLPPGTSWKDVCLPVL
jgi:hypothetical protein